MDPAGWSPLQAYGRSKLCNILFTRALARRLDGSGVVAASLHPGVIATKIGDSAGSFTGFGWRLAKPFLASPEKGARTSLFLATVSDPRPYHGAYLMTASRPSPTRPRSTTPWPNCSGPKAPGWSGCNRPLQPRFVAASQYVPARASCRFRASLRQNRTATARVAERGNAMADRDTAPDPAPGQTNMPDLASLAWALLRIGAFAFGGLGATLALLNRDLVERRGWLRSGDVSEALAYTKPLPGSTVVQVVTDLGWRIGGWPAAIVATIIFLLPAFAIMTVAAAAVSPCRTSRSSGAHWLVCRSRWPDCSAPHVASVPQRGRFRAAAYGAAGRRSGRPIRQRGAGRLARRACRDRVRPDEAPCLS